MSTRHTFLAPLGGALLLLAMVAAPTVLAAQSNTAWPERVLVTNDNGIHDEKVWALAKAFAKQNDTWLVAATRDRSGTSNFIRLDAFHRALTVRRVFKSNHLTAYAAPGYPADCVAFGVLGLLKDNPPDLVVSGVNGGANLGVRSWSGSGTIGAARTAALLGIPAIAVSGLDDDDKKMVAMATDWVVALAHSPIARSLKPGQYLTVAIPRVSADEIRGVQFAPRMPLIGHRFELERVRQQNDDGKPWEVWVAKSTGVNPDVPANSDVAWYRQGYIVITPMRIGEVDTGVIKALRAHSDALPQWPID